VTFHNIIIFYGELLAPRPTPKPEDYSLSAVRDCLFRIFAGTHHIWRPSPPSATWGRVMWQGTHLTWSRDLRLSNLKHDVTVYDPILLGHGPFTALHWTAQEELAVDCFIICSHRRSSRGVPSSCLFMYSFPVRPMTYYLGLLRNQTSLCPG
jgi:hypothetical protein